MNQLSMIILLTVLLGTECLVPAKFQWKIIDFAWKHSSLREKAIAEGSYIPENNMPTGLARWRDKLFITIPRWKKGVPCSLNYVFVDGPQQQPLRPYPSWREAFVTDTMTSCPSNSTVVSTFRVAVDESDRLWVVDNGVTDMASAVKQIAEPAILVFDLKTDRLLHRYVFGDELRDTSVLTSIVVDDTCGCENSTFAYITDMGSNAIIVFDLHYRAAWRVESPHFLFDPGAGVYRVGGIDFYWSDGVSSAVLSNNKRDGSRDLYVQPTSSTKTFKISTDVVTNKHASEEEKRNAVQLSRNGVSCWNMDKPFSPENTPLVISDCNLLEFPNDVKVAPIVLTDFHLSTSDGSVAVHKSYMAAHSDVFKAMLTKEWKETAEGQINIKGATVKTLQQLKNYVGYEGLCPLLLIARLYLIEDLEKQCIRKLAELVSADELYPLVQFACDNNIPELASAMLEITQNCVIAEAYKLKKESLEKQDESDTDSQE